MGLRSILIALGGNSITRPDEVGDLRQQYQHTSETMDELAGLLAEGVLDSFVLTHGNGPQVGNIILRSELSTPTLYPLTIDVCVSDSQGGMGYMIQQALGNSLRHAGLSRPIATVITQIEVRADDPAFANPTKYVGRFMTQEDALRKKEERGWAVREDKGRGWRRVVPSPQPLQVVELEAIATLYRAGVVCVAAGGGGIPVVRDATGNLTGVEGVIDKDLASALLANALSIDTMLIVTGANGVYTDYHTPQEKHHPVLTPDALAELHRQGHFPPGAMGPKVEAALRFLANGGRKVIICEDGHMAAALQGRAGTIVEN